MTRHRNAPDPLQGGLPFMDTVPEIPVTVVTVDGKRHAAQQTSIFDVLDAADAAEPTTRQSAVCGGCYARIPGCTEPDMGDAPGVTWATGTCASCGATAIVFWLLVSAAYAAS